MTVYKEICEEISVDVDLEDFDFEDICDYVSEVNSNDPAYYEKSLIEKLQRTLFYKNMNISDFIYQMERDEFNELFEVIKNSWQAQV